MNTTKSATSPATDACRKCKGTGTFFGLYTGKPFGSCFVCEGTGLKAVKAA